MIGQVALEGMEFYARHGYYAEERKIGNKYTVNIYMQVEMTAAVLHDKLEGTVDYERVYELVTEVMTEEANLLEHLAGKLIEKIKGSFANVLSVRVNVCKHNPPIKGLCQQAVVTLEG